MGQLRGMLRNFPFQKPSTFGTKVGRDLLPVNRVRGGRGEAGELPSIWNNLADRRGCVRLRAD